MAPERHCWQPGSPSTRVARAYRRCLPSGEPAPTTVGYSAKNNLNIPDGKMSTFLVSSVLQVDVVEI